MTERSVELSIGSVNMWSPCLIRPYMGIALRNHSAFCKRVNEAVVLHYTVSRVPVLELESW